MSTKRMSDFERLMECITCGRDPRLCDCTDEDEYENGSCKKWTRRRRKKNEREQVEVDAGM